MRTAVYKKWLYERQFTLPDEEEKKLKLIVRRSKNNQIVKDIKERAVLPVTELEAEENENYGPPPPVPKENTATAATVGVKTLLAHHSLYFNPVDGSRKRLSLNFLPMFLRERVFTFLPVVDPVFLKDLDTMEQMLRISDCEILRDAELADEVTRKVQREVLETHSKEFGEFALVARCMGITGVPVLRLANPAQLEYSRDLTRTLKLARQLSERQTKFRQWTDFRVASLDTTCAVLRPTFRGDLALWRSLLTEWRKEIPYDDVIGATAFEELAALESRVGGVEFLGSDEVELDDIRNMCFELDLPMPQGTSDDYAKSLTLAQSITLGMVDIPWVKGYAWEDRAVIVEAENEEATQRSALVGNKRVGGERTPSASSTVASSDEVIAAQEAKRRKVLLQAAICRDQDAMDQAAQDDQNTKNQEEADATAKLLKAKRERQRAAAVAADSMTQRIWISTEEYQQRWQHRFGGCEYCTSLPIHHVGLKHKTSAVTSDIALCNGCYDDMYADAKSVAHRMYQWYVVADLIGQMAPVDVVPLAEKPKLSEMAQQLSAIQEREERVAAEAASLMAADKEKELSEIQERAKEESEKREAAKRAELLESAPKTAGVD